MEMGAFVNVFFAAWLAAMPVGQGGASGAGAPAQSPAPAARPAPVAPVTDDETPIQDNSFLIEEAYNQETGVVQHITTFQRDMRSASWGLSFTQEWPAPSQTHQLSVTLPGLRIDATPGGDQAGLGDIALNYRYQLRSRGRTAISPRFSVYLPTGNHKLGRGAGAVGYQVNVPVSVEINRRLTTHLNAGATVVPGAKNQLDESATTWGANLGQSLIWLLHPRFNGMLEVLYTRTNAVVGDGRTEGANGLWINPGVRGAFNFKNGLQIVPGLAFPIGVGPSAGQRAVFIYLSFEHPFVRH
jgi:hypothetical protein